MFAGPSFSGNGGGGGQERCPKTGQVGKPSDCPGNKGGGCGKVGCGKK